MSSFPRPGFTRILYDLEEKGYLVMKTSGKSKLY